MRRVILESPYKGRGDTEEARARDRELNIIYAKFCARDCLQRGETPYGSHLMIATNDILNDDDEAERTLGIEAGLAWGEVAEASVVYTDRGVTSGMLAGIRAAQARGKPVEMRELPDYWHFFPRE